MGRWMEGRVIPYADMHGYGYYKATPDWIHNPLNKLLEKTKTNSIPWRGVLSVRDHVDITFNRVWIDVQIGSGKKITDIGQELNSPFYHLERKAVGGYPGYSQDIQENVDLRTVDTLRGEKL